MTQMLMQEVGEEPRPWRSCTDSQEEILMAIQSLHCPEGFECDMTYGNGSFWRTLPRPRLCFDISPQKPEAQVGDSRMLPVEPASLRNVVFDPPFLTYVKNGREHNSKVAMTSRFGGYYRYDELEDHYRDSISEAYRVLKPGGKMIFKCQDIIHNHRMHCTHFKVILMAEIEGFRLADMFVLAAKHRMPGPQKGQQRHARIWHSYFLVLEKASSRTGAVAPPPEDGANPRPLA
jgi:hypothetical protein